MPTPLISILHPTARVKPYASFPRGWRDACEQFYRTCSERAQVEYVLIVHESRWDEFWETHLETEYGYETVAVANVPDFPVCVMRIPNWGAIKIVKNNGRDCVVDQINAGAAACSGQLLIGIMDDLEAPSHWDEKLLDLLPDIKREQVIDLTGEPTEWIVYGAMTRARYERYGYALHPDFESMFADNYFSHVARADGVVIDGRKLGFRHNHPTNGRTQNDAIYELQNRPEAYDVGYATFQKLTTGKKILALAAPGEEFRAQWVWNLMNLCFGITSEFILVPHPGFSSNVYCTRHDIHNQILDRKPHADLVLWMDDDNICTWSHVERLVRDLEEHPELDGVVGWCWCDNDEREAGRPEDWVMSVGLLGGEDGSVCQRLTAEHLNLHAGNPIVPINWTGFPCVLLRYETLVKMGRNCFAPILHPDVKRGFVGEDTAFSWNAHRLGIRLAVDLRVKVPHVKWRAIEPVFEYVAPAMQEAAMA